MPRSSSKPYFAAAALLFAAALAPAIAQAAETLYVQSQKAKLLAEPKANADLVSMLSRGDALQLIESTTSWYRVRKAEQEGWVYRYFLADHPPINPIAPALTEEVDKEHARRRASAVVTAGATRGLTPEERDRAHQKGLADYSALERVDQLVIDKAELNRFLQAGIPQ